MATLKASRQKRLIRTVVNAAKALAPDQATAVLAAIDRCADDLARNASAETSRLSPEELALFAAYNAATLAPSQSLIQAALGLTSEEAADLCARLRDAAEHVASRQGRRAVLDRFKVMDAAPPYPDRA
jgi:Skp family chaperone for outer membrane proteins